MTTSSYKDDVYSEVAQWYLPAGRQGATFNYNKPMYQIYAIRAEKTGRIYVGMSQNIEKRVKEHNSGQVFSTKGFRP